MSALLTPKATDPNISKKDHQNFFTILDLHTEYAYRAL